MFCNFYYVKNHKIDKSSTTTKAREKIITDLSSLEFQKKKLMNVWLNSKTIKFYFIKLATDIYCQSGYLLGESKVAGDKGISETKSKEQSPCSNCMPQPVMSWCNACRTCMHKPVRCMHLPVTSQADACSYCMGSVDLILSWINLYSNYVGVKEPHSKLILTFK